MSTTPTLEQLLQESGLSDKAAQIENNLVRLQWGSAFVIVGVSGSAIVAIAPLFREVPRDNTSGFFKKLLEHNAYMGGMASFAIQPDGWVILHAGRPLKGIDGHELANMVAGVGRFADQFDDQLIAEFYAPRREGAAAEEPEDAAAAG